MNRTPEMELEIIAEWLNTCEPKETCFSIREQLDPSDMTAVHKRVMIQEARVQEGKLECRLDGVHWDHVLAIKDAGAVDVGINIHLYPYRYQSMCIQVPDGLLTAPHRRDMEDQKQIFLDLA